MLFAFFLASLALAVDAGDRPIIGVFAHPATSNGDYLAASYVKWVESAGGRVVPIPYNAPIEYLSSIVPQFNGILFPGGAAELNDQATFIVRLAIALNDKGTHFPIWGTCLGLEWLLQITADDIEILDHGFDAGNISLPLNFTDEARSSRIFGSMSADVYNWLATKPLTMNSHENGITTKHFAQSRKVSSFYKALATNVDRNGVEFISAFEAYNYPIYGVQFHPEKSMFEFGEKDSGTPHEVINHSFEAISASQYFANFFVNEARKNDQKFHDPHEERAALIYNYRTYTVKSPKFVETYLFKHDYPTSFWKVFV